MPVLSNGIILGSCPGGEGKGRLSASSHLWAPALRSDPHRDLRVVKDLVWFVTCWNPVSEGTIYFLKFHWLTFMRMINWEDCLVCSETRKLQSTAISTSPASAQFRILDITDGPNRRTYKRLKLFQHPFLVKATGAVTL